MELIAECIGDGKLLGFRAPTRRGRLGEEYLCGDEPKSAAFRQHLDRHEFTYEVLTGNRVLVRCEPEEIGFVKTLYHLTDDEGNANI